VQDTPSTITINLLEATTRADNARHIIAGFSLAFPTLAGLWRQLDDALADIPALTAEITGLNARLTASRLDRANLAAAGRATITAYRNGEPDALAYLHDELHAQGFGTHRGDA
jgi:hypothetical protein